MAWQKLEITDHRSGITDIIKNSPTSFQETAENLVHDNKEGNLEQRPGSEYWTDFDAPAKIRQLFQLENYIFAYCYDDPVDPEDDIDGRFYWVYSDGSSVAWTEVETEGTDTSYTIRLRDGNNKGLDITIPEGDGAFVRFVFTRFTTAGQNFPAISYLGGANPQIRISVLESRLNAAKDYIRGDSGLEYDYEDLKTFIEAIDPDYVVTYSPLTDAADFVNFTGSFEPDGESTDIQEGTGITTGRWDSGFLPAFTKQGHIKANKWAGELYLSLEPYNKSFVANDDDPYAENPDSFPPDNDRLPLRILYLQNIDTVITPVIQNAQQSPMYIGYDFQETSTLTTSDTSFRYAKVRFRLLGGANVPDAGVIDVYYERGCAPSPLQNIVGVDIRLDPSPRVDDFFNWSGVQPAYGQFKVYLSNSGTVQGAINQIISLFTPAAADNPYGSPFSFAVVLAEGALDNAYGSGFGPPTLATTMLYTAIPPGVNAANVIYTYGLYMQTEYEANNENAPRTYIQNGPVAFLSYPSLSPINNQQIVFNQNVGPANPFSTDKYPVIWLGRHKNYEYPSSLHIEDTDVAIVARSQGNGANLFLDRKVYDFEPIGSNIPPDSLYYSEDWITNVGETYEFTDRLADINLEDNEGAYFNGGVAINDSLPQQGSYYFTVVNQTGYHANIIGNVQRVYESPPGVPYAAPGLFFEDFDDGVTGISHFSDKPIIFTPNTTWRWEGTNGTTGEGRTFIRVVSDEFGAIANQSIVRTNMGLFFWSKTGICFTNGLKALRVTEHLIDSYLDWIEDLGAENGLIGPENLRGFFDEVNRRVLWSSVDSNGEPIYFALDIFEGVTDKMPVFVFRGNTNTYWDGAAYVITDQFQTSASLFSEDDNRLYRAQDTRVLIFNREKQTDDYWDGSTTLEVPVKTEFKSVAIDYGHRRDRKWTSRVMFGFEDLTKNGVSLQPLSWNDLTDVSERLGTCLNYQHVVWSADYSTYPVSDLQQFFLHTDVQFRSEHIVSYNRRFSKNRIRNVFKQLGWQPLPVNLGNLAEGASNIDAVSVQFISGTGKNLVKVLVDVSDTLDNGVIDLGIDNSGSYYVKWETQDDFAKVHNMELIGSTYELQIFITDESTNTFTYTDLGPITVGKVLPQRLSLSDYSLTFRVLSDQTHGIYKSEEQGGDNGN